MANFSYTAVNCVGKLFHGSIESTDQNSATRQIKQMGMFPTRVVEKQVEKTFFERFKSWFFRIEDGSVSSQASVMKTHFSYIAVDASGKQLKGTIEAVNVQEVTKLVKRMGYYPTQIVPG